MTGNIKVIYDFPHQRYPYFDVVVGLVWSMFLRDMTAVTQLLVEPPISGMRKVMAQTKRDTLVLQVEGCVWG
jgi:hypothetical protein